MSPPGSEPVVPAEAVGLAVRVGVALPLARIREEGVIKALQVGESEVGGVIVVGDLG